MMTFKKSNQEIVMDSLPKTRREACHFGSTKYDTGKPCRRGHFSYRYTASGICAKCSSEKTATLWKAGARQKPEIRKKANDNWNASKKAAEAKQRWKEKDPKRAWAVYATGGAKTRAYVKQVPFDLTSEYVQSITPDCCPVFGTQFVFTGNKRMRPESASLDRLDPEKGYIIGNVVVISMKANTIKNAYNSTDLYAVANWLQAQGY